MFMTTSLGQYQLTLFGTTSTAPATGIGADDRSVFLRPITAAGEAASETSPNTVEVQPATVEAQTEEPGYGDWLTRLAEYRGAAGGSGSSGVVSYGSQTTEPSDTKSNNDNGNAYGVGSNNGKSENAQAGTSNSSSNGNGAGAATSTSSGSSSGTNASSGNSGSGNSGSKGLLGLLFG